MSEGTGKTNDELLTPSPLEGGSAGIFASTSEAYERGKRAGRQELYDAAIQRLSEISVKHETDGSVEEFLVAEVCCGTLRSAKIILDKK